MVTGTWKSSGKLETRRRQKNMWLTWPCQSTNIREWADQGCLQRQDGGLQDLNDGVTHADGFWM